MRSTRSGHLESWRLLAGASPGFVPAEQPPSTKASSRGRAHSVLCIASDPERRGQIEALLGGDERFALTLAARLTETPEGDEPDLILLAVDDLARDNWRELLRESCAQGFGSAVVLLSAAARDEDVLEAIANGADDVVVFGPRDLDGLGSRLLLTLARHRRQQQLDRLIYLDSLTGLCNHRGFALEGEHQLALTQRTGLPLVLVILDIDGLKEINDLHGHRSGDKALIATADILRGTFRKSDLLARIGGDEFAAILRSPADPSATATKARVQQAFHGFNQTSGRPWELHASLGTATATPAERPRLADLVERADTAMYQEKRRRAALRTGERPRV